MNIFCDKCGCVENFGYLNNLNEAFNKARAAGWLIKYIEPKNIKHLCPVCYKKEQENKEGV